MSVWFGFFLRLFLCFVAAKFFLHAVGVEGREYLMGLTLLLLANVYWLGYLVFRDQRAASSPPGEQASESHPPREPISEG